jgi:hypothetical protein
MGYTRPATPSDTQELAELMRIEDRNEVYARYGVPPIVVLETGLLQSDPALTIVGDDDELVGMAGVCPEIADVGLVWMLGTDRLKQYRMQFLRKCIPLVQEWQERYPVLYNYVDERNTLHINWLRWLGFSFIKRHPKFGVEQIPFLEFVRLH